MFSKRLKELRDEKGISQKDLAEAVNLSQQAIAKYETDTATPNPDTLAAIANYFNVSIDYLVCNSDIKKAPATNDSDEGEPVQKMIQLLLTMSPENQKKAVRLFQIMFLDDPEMKPLLGDLEEYEA
jgi:transcriptional regulator with XRE-family HTH domain